MTVLAIPTLQAAEPSAVSLTDIKILFKRDPRLSGPTYGGEQWFSSPTFTSAVQPGTVGTVELRLRGVDAQGQPVPIVAKWTAANPEMVSVVPGTKGKFRVTVTRAGETTLTVAAQGIAKTLVVRAKNLGNAIQVEISHQPAGKKP